MSGTAWIVAGAVILAGATVVLILSELLLQWKKREIRREIYGNYE